MNSVFSYFLIIILCYLIVIPMAAASGVGNGSTIGPSAGQLENYGINGMQSGGSETGYATRHYYRGNYSGIGGSFLQTTSPTSESTPAIQPATLSPTSTSAMQFRLPKLDSVYLDEKSPALQSFTIQSPAISPSAAGSPMNEISAFRAGTSNASVEAMPSFNRQQSVMDKMQFSNFDYIGK